MTNQIKKTIDVNPQKFDEYIEGLGEEIRKIEEKHEINGKQNEEEKVIEVVSLYLGAIGETMQLLKFLTGSIIKIGVDKQSVKPIIEDLKNHFEKLEGPEYISTQRIKKPTVV